MKRYKVGLSRVEYLYQEIIVEAASEEDAVDKAWDNQGKWECVNADEDTDLVEVLK